MMVNNPRLLEQVRDSIRARHMSFRTEKTYLYWIRRFIRFHKLRHPREMGAPEVEAFLTSLAVDNKVAASTQNQALAAVLFLYRDVLQVDLPWLASVIRAKRPIHLPVVMTRVEVQRVLSNLSGTEWLVVSLLYGSGMRVTEGLQLRVKDIELSRHEILIRDSKGQKDRVTILPDSLVAPQKEHLGRVRMLFESDRDANKPGVSLPFALRRKYPHAATSWAW
jgi:integron integrase